MQVCIATRLTECRQAVEAAVWRRKFYYAIITGAAIGIAITGTAILIFPSGAWANALHTNKQGNYHYYAHGVSVKHMHTYDSEVKKHNVKH